MQGKRILLPLLMGIFFLINACESPSNEVLHQQKYGDKLKMSDNPAVFKLKDGKGLKKKYWVDYLGFDTSLTCLHRIAVLGPNKKRKEYVLVPLMNQQFPGIYNNEFQLKKWPGKSPTIEVGDKSFPMYVLPNYDAQKLKGFGFPQDIVPVILPDGAVEYFQLRYAKGSKKLLSLQTKKGFEYFQLADSSTPIFLRNIVMFDLMRMKVLTSNFCEWLDVQSVETNGSKHGQAGND